MSYPVPDDQVGGFLPSSGKSRIVVGSAEVFPIYGSVYFMRSQQCQTMAIEQNTSDCSL